MGIGGITLKEAKESLNHALKGDYVYPGDKDNAGSSPLQNGLNVESPTFKDSHLILSAPFDENNITVFAQIGGSHGVHSGHSHSDDQSFSKKDLLRIHATRSGERRIGGAQNDRLQPTRSNKAFNATYWS